MGAPAPKRRSVKAVRTKRRIAGGERGGRVSRPRAQAVFVPIAKRRQHGARSCCARRDELVSHADPE